MTHESLWRGAPSLARRVRYVGAGVVMSAAAAETPWVPFSSRYGLVEDPWGREHWTARHADHGIVQFGCCPPEPHKACGCPGSDGSRQCCEVATAEDLLCDACRDHCWAIDDAKKYHRLIDVYEVRP